ncbi:MAG: TolC family outer membrane protein, partial [Proteobacteria bacterium]|nr:TolC family outer membrane protein [Pseudomonadota bacterium]
SATLSCGTPGASVGRSGWISRKISLTAQHDRLGRMRRALPRWWLWLALGAISPSHAWAIADLVSVLEQAHATDPTYSEARSNALAAAEGIPQAQAEAWLPTLSFNGGASRVQQDITLEQGIGAGGEVAYTGRQFRITLNQPVFHFDSYMKVDQADLRLRQANFELAAAQQALIVRVAERYFDVLAAQDNLDFATAEKQSLNGQLVQAQQRFEVGLIAITDVQEAQAGYDRATANQIVAENELDNSREALRETTEIYYDKLATLGDAIRLTPPEPSDIEAWTQTALEQNLEISAANTASEIAQKEIRVQSSGHLPTLDLIGSHGFNAQGGRFGGSEVTQGDIALELNVPFYQGGRVTSRTRQASHEHNAALQRLEQARRAVFRETRQAYLGVIAEISTVKALSQAVLSSKTAVDATRAGFEVGTRTAVDVVDAERGLFQARRDFSRARYNYILDILRLKQAAGTLNNEDLAVANSWLVER